MLKHRFKRGEGLETVVIGVYVEMIVHGEPSRGCGYKVRQVLSVFTVCLPTSTKIVDLHSTPCSGGPCNSSLSFPTQNEDSSLLLVENT